MSVFSNVKSITIPEGAVTKIEVSGKTLWQVEAEGTEPLKGNLVPLSIDTDGSIYNGTGYADGYRISSNGAIKTQTGTALTGFMPCDGINDATIIRMKGAEFNSSLYTGLGLYDADFGLMYVIRYPAGTTINETIPGLVYTVTAGTESSMGDDGVTTITINFQESVLAANPPAYMRIFAQGSGADMIVTMDEEIV